MSVELVQHVLLTALLAIAQPHVSIADRDITQQTQQPQHVAPAQLLTAYPAMKLDTVINVAQIHT